MSSFYVVLLQEMGKGVANIHKRAFNLLALLEIILIILGRQVERRIQYESFLLQFILF